MEKDELVYARHMLDITRSILSKVDGLDRGVFDADENLRLAVTHLIQTIGEAARMVGEPTRQRAPEIPWRSIAGMRHRIVHDYLYVDFDRVWAVAVKDLQPLVHHLERLLDLPATEAEPPQN
jgi:uncharacterized protein with HEPN domain